MPFLNKLEIAGFKSFADKSYLEFKEGITAIVGPNGSGKSNIVEAFKFVLGEREAKNLRSEKSEDLIFAGNEKKSPAPFAEVKITFDNSQKLLPADYEEIEIKRKINKEGLSDYFLAKSQVRLKDIIEVLSKIKLGTKGLGIVNQGEADNILKAGPQERKIMIEEILGLKHYQIKKQEASRQLEAAKENIEKANALMEEILPHLRSLKRQTARWEKRNQVEESLQHLEIQYFGRRFYDLEKNRSFLSPKITDAQKKLEENENNIKQIENDLSLQESKNPSENAKLQEIEAQINALMEEKNKLSRNLGRIEAIIEDRKKSSALSPAKIAISSLPKLNISLLASTLKAVKSDLLNIKETGDIDSIKFKLNEIIKKIDALFEEPKINQLPLQDVQPEEAKIKSEIESYLKEQKTIEDNLSKIAAAINELQSKIKIIKENNELQNASFYNLIKKAESLRAAQRENEHQLNELRLEEEKEKLKEEDLKEDLRQANWQFGDFINKIKNLADSDEINIGELEEKIYKLRRELQAIGEIDNMIMEEAKSAEERYNFLEKQRGDLTQAITDLEKLIEELTAKIEKDLKSGIEKINLEFTNFFSLMFGSGKARLHFTKIEDESEAEENPQNSEEIKNIKNQEEKISRKKPEPGIEISINIPRKRIKSIEMLSGGEKAFTSIALLFAIVAAAEPPFLILDEIDAALDQRNTKIFTKILKDLSSKTQFILITHNNITMESANILYGVTMSPEGVSKILSLRLNKE